MYWKQKKTFSGKQQNWTTELQYIRHDLVKKINFVVQDQDFSFSLKTHAIRENLIEAYGDLLVNKLPIKSGLELQI